MMLQSFTCPAGETCYAKLSSCEFQTNCPYEAECRTEGMDNFFAVTIIGVHGIFLAGSTALIIITAQDESTIFLCIVNWSHNDNLCLSP